MKLWVQVFFARNELGDKSGDRLGKQFCFPLVGVDDGVSKAHLLQQHKAAQRSKDMVQYGHLATHLETLDVADLLEQAVILFNFPMLVMRLASTANINPIRWFFTVLRFFSHEYQESPVAKAGRSRQQGKYKPLISLDFQKSSTKIE